MDKERYFKEGMEHLEAGRRKEAVACLERAAGDEHAEAMFQLGLIYNRYVSDYNGVPPNDKTAACWFMRAAYLGHLEGMFQTGYVYSRGFFGFGIPTARQAVYWLKRAAKPGHVEAMYEIGQMYDHCPYIRGSNRRNKRKAIKWFEKAARRGNRPAMVSLYNYLYARIKPNKRKAAYWREQAEKIPCNEIVQEDYPYDSLNPKLFTQED
jgi:TPR repeat protein